MAAALRDELKKRNPFASVEQEAMLAIMRTSDLLENRMARLLREHGLTMSQYNVLRILRGEGKPMRCLEVAERMIQVAPAMTRVVEQLVSLGLINKTQSSADRRIFTLELKPKAIRLLDGLDQPVLDLHASLMRGVKKSDLESLLQTLDAIRASIGP